MTKDECPICGNGHGPTCLVGHPLVPEECGCWCRECADPDELAALEAELAG
jgi:hypothetical protein